jgi:hypothetical protein
MSLRLPLLKMGVVNEYIHLTGKTHVTNDLLKSMRKWYVNKNQDPCYYPISTQHPQPPKPSANHRIIRIRSLNKLDADYSDILTLYGKLIIVIKLDEKKKLTRLLC